MNRQIVGVRSGGSASCFRPNEPDFYAGLDRQWLSNPQAAGQLKVWLDPDNTGQRKIAGENPSATPPVMGGGSGLGLPLPAIFVGFGSLRRRPV